MTIKELGEEVVKLIDYMEYEYAKNKPIKYYIRRIKYKQWKGLFKRKEFIKEFENKYLSKEK